MNLLSICIPTYEMRGFGHVFLRQSFDVLTEQTFKDFNVIISDHSDNDLIENLCKEYGNKLKIEYCKNTKDRGNSSANINNAIRMADGKIIKILFQDDFLYDKNSLKNIVDNFDLSKDKWLITACIHTKDGVTFFKSLIPKYNNLIHLGNNTISSPSVLTIKNDEPILFDEKLIWLMDCDYYKRCFQRFGKPKIIQETNVVNRIGPHQISNTLVKAKIKIRELLYEIIKNK